MVVSRMGALSLVPMGQAFADASAADPTSYQVLGEIIHEGVVRTGYSIHMLLYCVGGVLWYYPPWCLAARSSPTAPKQWGCGTCG